AAAGFAPLARESQRQTGPLAPARSAGAGRFAFPVARARLHRLVVRAAGCAPATEFGCVGGREVTVVVGAGARVAGTVREHGTGRLLVGAVVRVLRGEPYLELATVHTAADGSFAVGDLPAVGVSIAAEAGGGACGFRTRRP